MNFRLRYHLSFLPLFIGLTAAGIGLDYIVERREVAWGLGEEAKARALCLAVFVERPQAGDTTTQRARRGVAASRLSHAADDLRVQWFEPEGSDWRSTSLVDSTALRAPPPPSAAIVAQLQRGESVSLLRSRNDVDYDEAIGYAGVRDDAGKLRAIVGVTGKDTVTRTELRALWHTGWWFGACALLASIIVAEILTRRAERDVAALSVGAQALARGEYGHDWRSSIVQELADLASTLEAIDRILRDSVRQTRRRFLRAEQLPSDEEIAAACAQVSAPPRDKAGPQYAIRRIGGGSHDDFWAMHRVAGGWHVVAGRLLTDDPAPALLERTVRAHAAGDYLRAQLELHDPAKAWRELDAVFRTARGASASLLGGEIVDVQANGSDRLVTSLPRAEGSLGALSTLEPGSARFIRDYLKNSRPTDLERAADELATLLAERDRGLLVIFSLSSVP
jgi:hypothetical protein